MFSPEQIDTIVKRAFEDEEVELLDHRFILHSKEKTGFLGLHQNLEVTVRRAGGTETTRFFVKSMPTGSEEQEKFVTELNLFKQEADFFNELLPQLCEYCKLEELCPKCLLATDKFIVLEDMRCRGFAMSDSKIFQADYLKAALRAQARLHACSLLAEAKLGKPLDELYPQVCAEHLFEQRLLDLNLMELYNDLVEQIASKLGRDARRAGTVLLRAFKRMMTDERKAKAKLGLVASHGDTWPNNYMFDASQPPRCVLLDFQLVRYAPRTYDVAQLLYLGSSREIRRREEREALEAYHAELCATLERAGQTGPKLEEVLLEFEEVRMSALLAAIMYYPIICMSKQELAKYDDNQEKLYQRIMFRKSNDYVIELYDRDPSYKTRFDEVVLELLDYCEKHDISELENGDLKNGVH